MKKIISEFEDGTKIGYGQGKFDAWCVYVGPAGEREYAPRDLDYFNQLVDISYVYGNIRVYDDFVRIYEQTSKWVNNTVLREILNISNTYGQHENEVRILFTVIYLAMIAEENKKNTKLGKRIKRLAIHQLLIDGMAPTYCANFSKNKKYHELENECDIRF